MASRAILDYRPICRSLDIGYANLWDDCVLAESRGILVLCRESFSYFHCAVRNVSSPIVPDFGYELGSGKPAFDNPGQKWKLPIDGTAKTVIHIYIYIWIITCIHLELPCNRLHLREMAPRKLMDLCGRLWRY